MDPGIKKKNKSPRVSLIIAVYKRADFLELVLSSIEKQTFRDVEVIIAEDDQSSIINDLVLRRKLTCPFPIKHVTQRDKGFRKNRILNKAVLTSEGEQLIFIDGDCVLHRKFVEEHANRLKPNTCLFGRRAMLSRRLTEELLRDGNINRLSFSYIFLSNTKHLEDGIYLPWLHSKRNAGVKGCNFSLSRDLFYRINGFDEDFEQPIGGEDDDIERRLRQIDAQFTCTKFKTVQYHLFHGGREGRGKYLKTEEGQTFVEKKGKEGLAFCKNGLSKP